MGRRLTREELRKIDEQITCAFQSFNKSEAEKYINKLRSLRPYDLEPYYNLLYGELIIQVASASGMVKEKSQKERIARETYYKLSFGS